ncbi:MAG: peptidylprolyl isomerase [Nitrospirae bacterium]|nr:peptidylprolyl isomerase [Nitrospirota bacterium]
MKKIFIIMMGLLALTVSTAFSESKGDVLAKIGDRTISLADLDRIIKFYPEERQKSFADNPRNKDMLLRRIVQGIVLSALAKKEGFDKDPMIREQLSLFENDFLATEFVKQKTAKDISVTDKDIEIYYKTHQDEFKVKEQVLARHILVKVDADASEEDKKKARTKAEDLLKRVKAGEDFAKLATEFSDDPSAKTKGGDLGYFSRGRMVKEFEDAAFALKPGDISDIVTTKYGYHIIKVTDKKGEETLPLESIMKERIRKKLLEDFRQAKIKDFIDKAIKDAGVELYRDKLIPPGMEEPAKEFRKESK